LLGIDLRSLAAFRIAWGALLFWDALHALTNARAFYSDTGMLPRGVLLGSGALDADHWCVHLIGGSTFFQVVLILIALVASVGVMVGWRTRVSLFIAWALTLSIQARNPHVLFGGDVVLRVMAFWGLFLPLGACWSVDERMGYAEPERSPHVSMGGMAALLQVACIYWFTAMLKSGNEWNRDGTGVYYVLMADQFARPLGRWLLGFPEFMKGLSFAIYWLELVGPFLAFIPWRSAWWRLLVVLTFWGFHLGLLLTLRLGPFPTLMMAAWLLFVPGMVWDWLALRLPSAHRNVGARTASPVLEALRHGVPGLLLAFVLLWNLATVHGERWNAWIVSPIRTVMHTLRLDQAWTLFAPTPITDNGWLVLDAELYDHSHIDLLRNGQSLTFAKPAAIHSEAPDWRWHKLESNLPAEASKPLRLPFGDYLARRWQPDDSQKRVREWTLYFMREETLPHHTVRVPDKVELARNPTFLYPP
jgi:hypothetical protein